VRQYWSRPLERRSTDLGAWKLTLYRFPGGHSGSDIGKNRPNPLKLIASLIAQCDGEISSLSGGQAMNAIPDRAQALLCLRDPEALRTHLAALPPVGKWSLTPVEGAVTVWDEWSRQAALDFLLSLPNGVQNWRADLPEVPAASTCVVLASSTEDTLTIGTHVRAAHAVVLERTANGAALHAQRCGFTLANSHSYPPWEGEADSPFVQAMVQAYRQVNGIDPEVAAVHVGLEPGVLLSQHPEIPAISIGPTILNPHSVREYADLSQLPRFSRFLARLLSGEWMWDL
jgi:dipeptidase D